MVAVLLCIALALVHFGLFVLLMLRIQSGDIDFPFPVFALALPIFGPIAGLQAVGREKQERDYTALNAFVKSNENTVYDYRQDNSENVVATEEILLLNSYADRRNAILNIMSENVREYLDVLLLAASNEDSEVVHYATANIMQIQNEFQNGLAQLSSAVYSEEITVDVLRDYIDLLSDYIESGLITGVLVHRQRLDLERALCLAVEDFGCDDLLALRLNNLIALEDFSAANLLVSQAMMEQIQDEALIDAIMNYYVSIGDGKSLRDYVAFVNRYFRDLSKELREQIRYWQEA